MSTTKEKWEIAYTMGYRMGDLSPYADEDSRFAYTRGVYDALVGSPRSPNRLSQVPYGEGYHAGLKRLKDIKDRSDMNAARIAKVREQRASVSSPVRAERRKAPAKLVLGRVAKR